MHEQIIKARQELGLSQSAFAKVTGIERSQIRRLEEGKSVTTTTLAKVLKHLPNLRVLHFQGVDLVQGAPEHPEVRQALSQLATAAQEVADAARRLLALAGAPPAAAAAAEEVEPELMDEIRELDEEVDAIRDPRRSH